MTTPHLDRIASPADLKPLSDAELAAVAQELRAEMIEVVQRTGGHLGASLGAIELTVALHKVFAAPEDKLVWDVGHQSYAHKMLTGRREAMAGLRQKGGLSGFPKRAESPYDAFGAGHSSTSISAALGFLMAARAEGRPDRAVAVIGDGALSGGMAFEALNHAGHLGLPLVAVLNDNDLSIAPPVGGLARSLRCPKSARQFFEALGWCYSGPVDGHDIGALRAAFERAREYKNGPLLVHCKTKKGRGHAPSENAPDGGHACAPSGPSKSQMPTYTHVFAQSLIAQAESDPRIVAITAAMPDGTGVDQFMQRFPERGFDVGIAEQHAVTLAAGMAAGGLRPFCAIYSTFLQRAYDQIIHDVALQNLPVRFAIDRAGPVGADGASHAGSFDIAALCAVPNMTVMAAADELELARMVATAAAHDAGPIAFRFPRGTGSGVSWSRSARPLQIGRGRVIRQGHKVAVLNFGSRLNAAEEACDRLAEEGLTPTLADARFAKPLDLDLLLTFSQTHSALVTIEEGSAGGFGAHVAEALSARGIFDDGLTLRMMTLPDRFMDQAAPAALYAEAQLDVAAIADRIRQIWLAL